MFRVEIPVINNKIKIDKSASRETRWMAVRVWSRGPAWLTSLNPFNLNNFVIYSMSILSRFERTFCLLPRSDDLGEPLCPRQRDTAFRQSLSRLRFSGRQAVRVWGISSIRSGHTDKIWTGFTCEAIIANTRKSYVDPFALQIELIMVLIFFYYRVYQGLARALL